MVGDSIESELKVLVNFLQLPPFVKQVAAFRVPLQEMLLFVVVVSVSGPRYVLFVHDELLAP